MGTSTGLKLRSGRRGLGHRCLRIATAGLLGVGCVVGLASPADADWPMARHDSARTGRSAATSNIVDPVVYWRAYVGGAIGQADMLVADVDGDGVNDVVLLSGGAIIAKTPNDKTLWKSDLLGVLQLHAIADLDGDGVADIVVSTQDHVYVLSGKSGAIEWSEPDGEMGTVGGVRIEDLDGDGSLDLLVQECGCCAITSGQPGSVYSFSSGFVAPRQLWTLPQVYCGVTGTTVFDPKGDGTRSVALPTSTAMRIVDGATGDVMATSAPLGTLMMLSACYPADIDGLPGEELVCIQNVNQGVGSGGRQVFALRYSEAPAPSVDVLWQINIGDFSGGDLSTPPEFVVVLDGDGKLELVLAGKSASGAWTTYVIDAASGATITQAPGGPAVGTAALTSNGRTVLTVENGTDLSGWAYKGGATPSLTQEWLLPGRAAFSYPEPSLARKTSLSSKLVTLDLDGDGLDDIVTKPVSGVAKLTAYSVASGSLTSIGSYNVPKDVSIFSAWIVPPVTTEKSRLGVLRNDGFLPFLDNKLQVANVSDTGDPGLRVGGSYSAATASGPNAAVGNEPVIGHLDTGPDALLAVDSRGTLVRLDSVSASKAFPPTVLWERARTNAPAIVEDLDGKGPAVLCATQRLPPTIPPEFGIAAVTPEGGSYWLALAPSRPSYDVVPANFGAAGSGAVFQWFDAGGLVHTRALSKSGDLLWDAVPVPISWGLRPLALFDWDGDGADDVATVLDSLRILSGRDGSQQFDGGQFLAYFVPTPSDVDGDGITELTLSGGYFPARTLKHDLVDVTWTGADDKPYPIGAVGKCSSGSVLAEGSSAFPSTIKLTPLAGASIGRSQTLVLAGGKTYTDEGAAVAAHAQLGQLGTVSVSDDLGKGHPSAAVGSSDGWLYVLDLCGAKLDYAVKLGSPVGEPLFGDTDGDGHDEMIVSAADGYVYDIRDKCIDAPSTVLDIDPAHVDRNVDVDITVTKDSLAVSWSAVEGAIGYEVAVVGPDGASVLNPTWRKAGAKTQITLSGLPLKNVARYVAVVRALAKGCTSVDALSDGTVVQFPSETTSSTSGEGGGGGGGGGSPSRIVASGGCGCFIREERAAALPAFAGLMVGLLALSRRRR